MNWQPIETAPKDGTTILVVHQGSREVIPVKANPDLAVYLVEDGSITHGYAHWRNLTHWQPLPEPPTNG